MFLISSILDKRLEKQCWTFTTLAYCPGQLCKWCKYSYGKREKKRVHPPFCIRLYDLFLKVCFLESWFLVLFQFMKILKTREKCFFYLVVPTHAPLTVFSQWGFYRTVKENLVYLFNTIEGKTKTNFYYSNVIFSKRNKI